VTGVEALRFWAVLAAAGVGGAGEEGLVLALVVRPDLVRLMVPLGVAGAWTVMRPESSVSGCASVTGVGLARGDGRLLLLPVSA
jgi:hypothetical protein